MSKSTEIRARCLPSLRRALELMAELEQRSLPEMLRQVVREAAELRGLWPPSRNDKQTQTRSQEVRYE